MRSNILTAFLQLKLSRVHGNFTSCLLREVCLYVIHIPHQKYFGPERFHRLSTQCLEFDGTPLQTFFVDDGRCVQVRRSKTADSLTVQVKLIPSAKYYNITFITT